MTDQDLNERLARLQQRRSGSGATGSPRTPESARLAATRRRPKHPALGSRIAATSLGLSATFGLVAAMALGGNDGADATTDVAALPSTRFAADRFTAADGTTPPVVRLVPVEAADRRNTPAQPVPAPTIGSTHGSR